MIFLMLFWVTFHGSKEQGEYYLKVGNVERNVKLKRNCSKRNSEAHVNPMKHDPISCRFEARRTKNKGFLERNKHIKHIKFLMNSFRKMLFDFVLIFFHKYCALLVIIKLK